MSSKRSIKSFNARFKTCPKICLWGALHNTEEEHMKIVKSWSMRWDDILRDVLFPDEELAA